MKVINYIKLLENLEANTKEFNSKKPFKYIILDDFLNLDYAKNILNEFPIIDSKWKDARGHHSQNKWTLPIHKKDEIASGFMNETKSGEFLDYCSKLTSIPDLIYDSTHCGAGYHQSTSGGFLNVHVDFNKLNTNNIVAKVNDNIKLDRRLNLIVYFNENWTPEKGGYLELWDMAQNKRIENISPIFNRCVIFETNEVSFHGNPKPLKLNQNESRKSLSIYYYTKGRIDIDHVDPHNTIYINTDSIFGFMKTFINGVKHLLRKYFNFK